MGLQTTKKGDNNRPRRVMPYGVHGIGKSTFAANFPSPVFIETEDGLEGIQTHAVGDGVAKSYDEVMDRLRQVYQEEHDFKTVVIDSVDWLEQLIFAKVCEDKRVKTIEDIGYAKGYVFAMEYWKVVLQALEDINLQRGMHIVLISHCAIEKFEDPCDANYDRFTPALHKKTSAPLLMQWVDEVLFLRREVFTQSAGEEFGKKKFKAKAGEPMLYTTEMPFYTAKNRANLPEAMTFDMYAAYRYLQAVYGDLKELYGTEIELPQE
jgi:hypothetical protein